MKRKTLWLAIAAITIAAIGTGLALGGNGRTNDKTFVYSIGLYGDLPYDDGGAQTKGMPNLIADMNASKLEFAVHDGDLKQGNGPPTCSDALYANALDSFNSF